MTTSRHEGMGRRDFLRTSACALATAAVGPKLIAGLAVEPRLIVAGFAPLEIESAGTGSLERNVMAAERIAFADRAFLRHGARVSMNGVSGRHPGARRAVDFLTHYAYTADGGEQRFVPYHVWAGHAGMPVRFTVPVDEQQRIRFSVTAPMPVVKDAAPESRRFLARKPKTELAPTALPVELSFDGRVKLTRGYYVIVPVYDGEKAPDWSSYSLAKDGSRWTLHTRDAKPAAFEHFVVRVDYATPKDPRA